MTNESPSEKPSEPVNGRSDDWYHAFSVNGLKLPERTPEQRKHDWEELQRDIERIHNSIMNGEI